SSNDSVTVITCIIYRTLPWTQPVAIDCCFQGLHRKARSLDAANPFKKRKDRIEKCASPKYNHSTFRKRSSRKTGGSSQNLSCK
uniref:Uncharacterized protein n=1 Tax=Anopheles atroparvus TaxID=41427 RepID=A0AAG5D2M6_ANOAO